MFLLSGPIKAKPALVRKQKQNPTSFEMVFAEIRGADIEDERPCRPQILIF